MNIYTNYTFIQIRIEKNSQKAGTDDEVPATCYNDVKTMKYQISDELTGIFRHTREDVSQDTAEKMDEIWTGLQTAVFMLNQTAEERPDLDETVVKEALSKAEHFAFWKLNRLLQEVMIEDETIDENSLNAYLKQRLAEETDLNDDEIFRKAIRLCTDDSLLFQIAMKAPDQIFSFSDIAASALKSDDYRYAMACSFIRGRKTMIHDLALSRELDEMTAIRILLTDPYTENKRESMYVIGSEELLMLAWLQSVSYKNTARERLEEIGSKYPGLYFETEEEEKKILTKKWYTKACEYAQTLIDMDQTTAEKIDSDILIDSSMLICFLAACHPDQTKREEYAQMIGSEELAAYVGAISDYPDVKAILASKIHSERLLDDLPYTDTIINPPLLIRDRIENHIAFCLEILKNTDSEETRQYLKERMEKADIEIPEEFR